MIFGTRLIENDIIDNVKVGVFVSDQSNPTLRENHIHDGQNDGVSVINNEQAKAYIGRDGRFGRDVSLYHFRSQLFVRFVGTIPTADRAVF